MLDDNQIYMHALCRTATKSINIGRNHITSYIIYANILQPMISQCHQEGKVFMPLVY